MAENRAFQNIRMNEREEKPRTKGLTEIRGPYYDVMGKNYLQDIMDTMGGNVDILKFSGGAFTLYPEDKLTELIDIAHAHDVKVSTGGFIENVLTQGPEAVDHYLKECKRLGFDIVEVSTGFITMPTDDVVKVVEKVQQEGLLAKPEIGVQFGSGGTNTVEENEAEGIMDPSQAIETGKRCLDAGAYMLMIESEGITESVNEWRTGVATQFANELGIDNVMFESADPDVFEWYIKNYGPEVNLFVDHSQIVQLEALRRGIWGTKDLFGRVITYKN